MINPTQPQKWSEDLVVAVAVLAVVGLVAAIWWTQWFVPVRADAQNKAVLSNGMALEAGADQFFMNHPGVTSVATVTLVGTNSTQNSSFWYKADETYAPVIAQEHAFTAMGIAGVRTITFGP